MIPSTTKPFLGSSCDSGGQAFLHPKDKKGKFAELREAILRKKSVKTLRTFTGKTTSFALLVPQLSCTPILCIRPFPELLRVSLAKLNYLLSFEMKFPTGVSLIAGKDSCLGATSLTYRFNCFRMPLNFECGGCFSRTGRIVDAIRGC